MKLLRIIIFICSAYLFTSFQIPARTVHHYSIHVAGIHIGSLEATREINNGLTFYHLSSEVSFYLLHRYHITDDLKAYYKNDMLIYATVRTTANKEHYHSDIIWSKDHYDVDIDGYHYKRKTEEEEMIRYSVARIYFEEAPSYAKVFSEVFGTFSNVEKLSGHINQFVFNDKKNSFAYSGQDMVKAEIHNSFRDFIITRIGE